MQKKVCRYAFNLCVHFCNLPQLNLTPINGTYHRLCIRSAEWYKNYTYLCWILLHYFIGPFSFIDSYAIYSVIMINLSCPVHAIYILSGTPKNGHFIGMAPESESFSGQQIYTSHETNPMKWNGYAGLGVGRWISFPQNQSSHKECGRSSLIYINSCFMPLIHIQICMGIEKS